MLEWLANNWGGLLIGAILIAVVVLIIVGIVKDKKKGKSSCGCKCSSCAMCGKCHSAAAKKSSDKSVK